MRAAHSADQTHLERASEALPGALGGLLTPRAYPHPVGAVTVIETPISWVVLAGAFAYKIKRPVRYPFVDQRSAQRRHWLCEEELRLNRRFAPQLYLEVCPIVMSDSQARVCPGHADADKVLEYAVRMQRFAAEDVLDRQLAAGRIAPEALERFGQELADIHATLPSVTDDAPWGKPARVRKLLTDNLIQCAAAAAEFAAGEAVLASSLALERRLAEASPWMAIRRATARVRECHGDLHSRNIVVREGRLVPFDCLEYEPAFRWIDVADEVAFLTSDLTSRGCREHAHALRSAYLERSGDYHACRLIKLYEAHRALVRAKVAALAAAMPGSHAQRAALREEHARLVAHAAHALAERHPHLVLMTGLSGSGKTWMARRVARSLGAVHLRSDVERKRRAGLTALERGGTGLAVGLYASEVSARVYDDLAREAYDALMGGYTAIVDATLLRRDERRRFAELGARARAPTHLVSCKAPLSVLRERLRARAAARSDPSEADDSVLEWQRRRLEPVGAREPLDAIEVETSDPRALEKVLARLDAPVD